MAKLVLHHQPCSSPFCHHPSKSCTSANLCNNYGGIRNEPFGRRRRQRKSMNGGSVNASSRAVGQEIFAKGAERQRNSFGIATDIFPAPPTI